MNERESKWTLPLLVGGTVIYLILGLHTDLVLMTQTRPPPPPLLEDFTYYLNAWSAVIHHRDPYAIRKIGPAFLYPPPALFVVGFFAAIKDPLYRASVFMIVNSSLLAVMLIGTARRYGLTVAQVWWWFPLAFGFAPFLELLHTGQINLITTFGIFIMLMYENTRQGLAGIGLAGAICTKASPALLVFYLIINQRKQVIISTIVSIVIACLAFGVIFGWHPLFTYPDVFRGLLDTYLPGDGNGQSLVALLRYHDVIGAHTAPMVQRLLTVYVAVLIVVSGLLAVLLRKTEALFIMIGFGTVISANIVWYHHYVFLLLPIFVWLASTRLHPAVMLWCFVGLIAIQIDRWSLTRGLLPHLFVHACMLWIVADQVIAVVRTRPLRHIERFAEEAM